MCDDAFLIAWMEEIGNFFIVGIVIKKQLFSEINFIAYVNVIKLENYLLENTGWEYSRTLQILQILINK